MISLGIVHGEMFEAKLVGPIGDEQSRVGCQCNLSKVIVTRRNVQLKIVSRNLQPLPGFVGPLERIKTNLVTKTKLSKLIS
jgi:hypothetical protein